MSTRTNLTIHSTPQFAILSEDQKESIFNGMIETLQYTGLDVRHAAARDLLAEHGCLIDDNIVKIPPQLVRRALSSLPPVTVIHNWDGSGKLRIEKNRTYFGPGPTNPNFIDPITMERRKYLKKDPAVVAQVCDALPNIVLFNPWGPSAMLPKGWPTYTSSLR